MRETVSADVLNADNARDGQCGAAGAASLVSVTQLVDRRPMPVRVTVWPDCGEASVVFIGADSGGVFEDDEAGPASCTVLADVLRFENSQRVRASRARARVRRYCVRNMLTRMWTFTFADAVHDRAVALAAMQEFVRLLRDHFGEPFPYLYVFELHPKGHGWHVHLLTQSRWVKKDTMQRLWGHGIVQYSDGPKRHGRSKREVARGAARYAAKYVGKDIEGGLERGVHAYEPGQGFQPERVSRLAVSMRSGVGVAVRAFDGVAPSSLWDSAESEVWSGPPVITLQFEEAA